MGENTGQTKSKKTKNWADRIKESFPGLLVGIVATVIIGSSNVLDSIENIAVSTGLKSSRELKLAEGNAKGEFSRDLTKAAWQRLFWMRRVLLSQRYGYSDAEKEYTWNKYLEILEEWNSKLMINIMTVDKLYPEKRSLFESDIQGKFGSIHYCLERQRHLEREINCSI